MTVDPCDAGPRGSGDDMRFFCTTLSASLFLLISAGPASPAELGEVDANVLVAVDVSGSIDGYAERLELEGLAETLIHPAFVNAVERGPVGSIGFAAYTWSSQGDHVLIVPWTRVGSLEDGSRIAADLMEIRKGVRFRHHSFQAARPWRVSLGTDVSEAIAMGTRLLGDSPFASDRALLNIFANGVDNVGDGPDRARDEAIAAGITINAMILRHQVEVVDYYRAHVQGGPGSFTISADEFGDVIDTMLTKFMLELAEWRVPDRSHGGRILALVGML